MSKIYPDSAEYDPVGTENGHIASKYVQDVQLFRFFWT